jgi:hypothetical protein
VVLGTSSPQLLQLIVGAREEKKTRQNQKKREKNAPKSFDPNQSINQSVIVQKKASGRRGGICRFKFVKTQKSLFFAI